MENIPDEINYFIFEIICTDGMAEEEALLWRFVNSVREAKMPCKDDIKRLALCFEKILAGDDPKIALGLGGKQSQGRGRRHGSELYKKEIFPIFQVEILRTEGLTLESAISQVSNKEGIPYDTLVRYHKRWRKGVTSQIQARLANDYPLPCLEQMSAWKIENAGRMFTCFEKNHKKKNSKKDKAPGETMK